jgi:hypothetical protein
MTRSPFMKTGISGAFLRAARPALHRAYATLPDCAPFATALTIVNEGVTQGAPNSLQPIFAIRYNHAARGKDAT